VSMRHVNLDDLARAEYEQQREEWLGERPLPAWRALSVSQRSFWIDRAASVLQRCDG
jgi:hypothetical protein